MSEHEISKKMCTLRYNNLSFKNKAACHPDQPFHSFKIRRMTFLNYIEFADLLIVTLQNCEKAGRDIIIFVDRNVVYFF